jgi:hypothetical protein
VRGCTRASPAHASRHVGQRQFHCGKPPPPPNPGRGRSIAPFRIDASGDQNSAGKYPLISRPMQISTRVGVVQAMVAFPSYPNSRKLGRARPMRKDRSAGRPTFLNKAQRKTGPLRVRLQFVGAGADNHLPEGNS